MTVGLRKTIRIKWRALKFLLLTSSTGYLSMLAAARFKAGGWWLGANLQGYIKFLFLSESVTGQHEDPRRAISGAICISFHNGNNCQEIPGACHHTRVAIFVQQESERANG